ncbi:alpha/beta hydrolase [Flavobacteriaceae bacterium F08102]|nr:alpha/beta hydrolase [Flavobacteriaceae bacterium F08102]
MIKVSILLFGAMYILVALGFYFFQENIIFRAKKLASNTRLTRLKKWEEIFVQTLGGGQIHGIYCKVKNSKGILVYFHGNKGNLQRWQKLVAPYTAYEYDVLVVDYRGYGKSTGKRSESLMYNDAKAVYDYVQSDLNYEEDKIVVYGRSLGCTFALWVASGNSPKQLVLEAPFNSLLEVIRHKFPLLPYPYLLKFPFKSHEIIPQVKVPTVIFHGDCDAIVPVESGKRLFEMSNKKQTEFVLLKSGNHHNLTYFDKYREKMKLILN